MAKKKAVYEYLDIYNRKLIFGSDMAAMRKLAARKLGKNADISLMETDASIAGLAGPIFDKKVEDKVLAYFMYVGPKEDAGTLAHEANHIVNFVFDYVGQQLDLTNDEAQSYLLGHIVKRFTKTIRGK